MSDIEPSRWIAERRELRAQNEQLRELLEKALPFLGSAASRSQIIVGVDAGELYLAVEAALEQNDNNAVNPQK